MLVDYMRVSTDEQTLGLQRDALERAGGERVFENVCSSTVAERPSMDRALDHTRTGDVRVVRRLDRIDRSFNNIVQVVDSIRERGVDPKELASEIDRTSSTGRSMFGIVATPAVSECDLIHERTMAGLTAARACGRHDGRPRMTTKSRVKVARALMADQDIAALGMAEQIDVLPSALSAYVDCEGQPKVRAYLSIGDIKRPLPMPAMPPVIVRHSVEGR